MPKPTVKQIMEEGHVWALAADPRFEICLFCGLLVECESLTGAALLEKWWGPCEVHIAETEARKNEPVSERDQRLLDAVRNWDEKKNGPMTLSHFNHLVEEWSSS